MWGSGFMRLRPYSFRLYLSWAGSSCKNLGSLWSLVCVKLNVQPNLRNSFHCSVHLVNLDLLFLVELPLWYQNAGTNSKTERRKRNVIAKISAMLKSQKLYIFPFSTKWNYNFSFLRWPKSKSRNAFIFYLFSVNRKKALDNNNTYLSSTMLKLLQRFAIASEMILLCWVRQWLQLHIH